jgi:hypothetical protein
MAGTPLSSYTESPLKTLPLLEAGGFRCAGPVEVPYLFLSSWLL